MSKSATAIIIGYVAVAAAGDLSAFANSREAAKAKGEIPPPFDWQLCIARVGLALCAAIATVAGVAP